MSVSVRPRGDAGQGGDGAGMHSGREAEWRVEEDKVVGKDRKAGLMLALDQAGTTWEG